MSKITINNFVNPLIIIDTNFLLLPEQFKIDIFEQFKSITNNQNPIFSVFDKTIDELKKISNKNSKHSISAKIGLKLIENLKKENKITIIKSNDDNYVDFLLINYKHYVDLVNKSNFYIATQDKELKSILKEKNIKLIILAQKNILKFA